MLRGVLGDDPFFRSIQRYCRDNQERSVITQDLVDAIEAETGRNLEWFFDQWVYQAGPPGVQGQLELGRQHAKRRDGDREADAEDRRRHADLPRPGDHRLPHGPRTSAGVPRRGHRAGADLRLPARQEAGPLPLRPVQRGAQGARLRQVDRGTAAPTARRRRHRRAPGGGRALGKKGGPEAVAALRKRPRTTGSGACRRPPRRRSARCVRPEAREASPRFARGAAPQGAARRRRGAGRVPGDADRSRRARAVRDDATRRGSWKSEANRSIGKLRVAGSFERDRGEHRPRRRSARFVRVGCIDGLVELRDERGIEPDRAAAKYGVRRRSRPPRSGQSDGLRTLRSTEAGGR